jgi:hypothetical protein
MENLTPPLLQAVREVRWAIGSGLSVNEAVRIYLEQASGEFAQRFRAWWLQETQSSGPRPPPPTGTTFLQAQFFELIRRGRAGQPLSEVLRGLEEEIERSAQAELEMHLAALPFRVLLPLLLFQFPAYLILLLGPLLRDLQQSFMR